MDSSTTEEFENFENISISNLEFGNISNETNKTEGELLESIVKYNFLPFGPFLIFFVIFGLGGNLLSTLVLFRFRRESTYTIVNFGLAICDSTLLLGGLFRFGLTSMFTYFGILSIYNEVLYPFSGPYLRIIYFVAYTGSIYFTIGLALDRYITIRWPLKSRLFWSIRKAKILSICIVIFSVLLNIPACFDYRTIVSNQTSVADSNRTTYEMKETEFYYSHINVFYYVPIFIIIQYLLPFCLIAYLNFYIWKALREATRIRQSLSLADKENNNFALMLSAVLIVFIICTVNIFYQEVISFFEIPSDEFWLDFARLCTIINSAVNFVIYFLMGKTFRGECLKYLREIFLKFMPNISKRDEKEKQKNGSSATVSSTCV